MFLFVAFHSSPTNHFYRLLLQDYEVADVGDIISFITSHNATVCRSVSYDAIMYNGIHTWEAFAAEFLI